MERYKGDINLTQQGFPWTNLSPKDLRTEFGRKMDGKSIFNLDKFVGFSRFMWRGALVEKETTENLLLLGFLTSSEHPVPQRAKIVCLVRSSKENEGYKKVTVIRTKEDSMSTKRLVAVTYDLGTNLLEEILVGVGLNESIQGKTKDKFVRDFLLVKREDPVSKLITQGMLETARRDRGNLAIIRVRKSSSSTGYFAEIEDTNFRTSMENDFVVFSGPHDNSAWNLRIPTKL